MKKRVVFVLLLQFFVAYSIGAEGLKYGPSDANASLEVRRLLAFLYSVQGKYTLSGQHNFISDLERYETAVQKVTGKTPVVWGSDFSFNISGDNVNNFQHCGPMNLTVPFDTCTYINQSTYVLRTNMIKEAMSQYKQGRIITLMWHSCFPSDGNTCNGETVWAGDNRIPDTLWQELVTPGTVLNDQWRQQADSIAFYLKQLQTENIPVLWRPYHEMNGGWFWWGGHPGNNGYKKLWIMMYNYFTKFHQLHNLIWVWNANAISKWVPAYDDYFPGIEYVDVLATDVYRREYTRETYDELVRLSQGKIVSLGEIGEVPDIKQYEEQPFSWFMNWGYYIDQYNDPADVNKIYHHPRTITLNEIDFQDNTYKLKK